MWPIDFERESTARRLDLKLAEKRAARPPAWTRECVENHSAKPLVSDHTSRDMNGGAAIECRDLQQTYQLGSASRIRQLLGLEQSIPEVDALDGISLEVSPGEFVGVSGPSGSGKTTLLHLIAGLETPTGGTVTVDGVRVDELSAGERTKFRLNTVGVVFQRFHLLGSLSARANVALPLLERGEPKKQRRERAETLLEEVGLGDRLTHRPGQLSGGERQRVAVARALATDPALIVADEPTGELDSETADRVLDALATVSEGRTVLLASHDDRALERTDRVIDLGERTTEPVSPETNAR